MKKQGLEVIDIDSIIKKVHDEAKEAEKTGIYVHVPGMHIPLRLSELTLWNWTKIFLEYVAPARDRLKKLKGD